MRVKKILGQVLAGTILLLFTTFVAACGSSSAAAVTTSTATTTATSCFTQATGTIQGINGTTLLIAGPRGTQIHATYTSNTVFLRETTLTPAGLQEGMNVAVRAVKNSDNSYSAVQVTVRNSSTSTFTPRSSTGSIRSCTPRQRSNGGNGRGNFTGGQGGTTSSQNLVGTVGQLNGNMLTVNDTSGADYTVQLTSATQIRTDSTATATDLQAGKAVTVVGTSDNHGGITARQVLILLRLPNRPNTTTGQ
jgi:Domain of unknown function (DUF5666)